MRTHPAGPTLLVALALAAPLTAENATYHLKLTYTGMYGPHAAAPPACPHSSRGGTDVYEGDLGGDEDDFKTEQEVTYTGKMKRTTNIDVCDVKPEDANGVADYCNTRLTITGEYQTDLQVYSDRAEVYFTMEPVAGTVRVNASGDCDAQLTREIRDLYSTEGDGVEHVIGKSQVTSRDVAGGPPKPGTYPPQPPRDPSSVGYWQLVVGPPDVLRAEAGGPYRVERGQTVRLDGSRSTGRIQNYTWTLVAEPCPDYPPHLAAETPSRRTRNGAVVELKALCPLTAKLVVSDGGGFDEDYTKVEVVPRTWTTKIDKAVTGRFSGNVLLFPCLHCQWGINLCAEEFAAGQMTSGHQIHSANVGNWEGPQGFVVQPLHDPDGLWDGWWYVTENHLKMQRAELVHQDLFPPSCAVEHSLAFNASAHATVCDVSTLRSAIAEHERQHTRLLDQKLREAGVDPAPDIEGFVASSGRRSAVVDAANQRIGIADGELFPLTENDAEVAAAMAHPPYTSAGVIFLPTSGPVGTGAGRCASVDYDSYDIPSFAQMGVEGK